MMKNNLVLFFSLAFAFMVRGIVAGSMRDNAGGIAKLDDYLKQRADNATKAAIEAYNPHPEMFTMNLTHEVQESLKNATRGRHLKEKSIGGCRAENPIDRCWRCRANWAENRKDLAKCARGFGIGTTGGAAGKIYIVTDPTDEDPVNPKEGTLRWGVVQNEPLWIIFARSMQITLHYELMINSHKTIDGRGVKVEISGGAGLTIQFVENVIVHNIWIRHITPTPGGMIRDSSAHYGFRTQSDGDGISIFGSSRVWIDHVSLERCADGLIDAIMASTAITISNCKFNNHNDVMLLGAHDGYEGDQIMQVTVAFNKFGKGLIQRMPRCRWGFFHVLNNDYNQWEMYAIGGSMHPTIISQGNRFKAPPNIFAKEVTHRDHSPEDVWKNWNWKSIDDEFHNGAFFKESGGGAVKDIAAGHKEHMIQAKNGGAVVRLTRYSGALLCFRGTPC